MKKLNKEEIEFITKCLKGNKPLPDVYRYIIPFETSLHAHSGHREK